MQKNPDYIDAQDLNLKETLQPYTRNWFWFLMCIVISLAISKVYLRYTIPSYSSSASILIKHDASSENFGSISPFSGRETIGGLGLSKNSLVNELAILKSKRLIAEVVKELKLNITYESIGTIITPELYDDRPFTVHYLSPQDSLLQNGVPKLFFTILSENEFNVTTENEKINEIHRFGEPIILPFGEITVLPISTKSISFSEFIGKSISVQYTSISKMASYLQNKISVQEDQNYRDVIALSMQSSVRKKAEDFINELINQYNLDAIKDRNQIALKTSDFIDSRLEIITRELDSVEQNKENFKSSNKITNIEVESQLILQSATEFDKKQLDFGTKLEMANTMINQLNNTDTYVLLPSNIGSEEGQLSTSVTNYNQLLLERSRLLKNSTAQNPVVQNLNNQISQLRASILESLENQRNNLKISLKDLNIKESTLNSEIAEVPRKERLFREINRQQGIKEQLFLFLLQQREEASIALAVTGPKAKIIDKAHSSGGPVSPNRIAFYSGALLVGFLIPFGIIYLSTLLDTKIKNKRDVERIVPKVEFLGEIPKLGRNDEELVQKSDRSMMAESFRILRTNLQYQLLNKIEKKVAPRIFVTSTVKGEGKTFVAFNLALTLALTGKKVILVGADIRNPQLHRYLPKEENTRKGLTEYIIDESVTATELVQPSIYNDNLSIIHSGVIPPNPAELLLQPRTKTFFEELENDFDYIIVDTAPAMLVTDTILLSKYADTMLYVARAGYTDKKLLDFLKDAIASGRLAKIALVLNSVSQNNFGYGNKYGYAYTTTEQKSFFSKWFS